MSVNVTNQVGCRLCNTATISSPSQSAGAQISSNTLCIGNAPAPNPDGAHASGNATGANVQSSLLSLDLTLPTGNDGSGDHTSVDSSQSGLGSNSESNQVLAVDVPPPPPGSVLHADVLRAVTTSTGTQTPSQATATS